MATSWPGVFAGGDVVSGPASVIESIAAGKRAAEAITLYLGGKVEVPADDKTDTFLAFNSQYLQKTDRVEVPKIPVMQRGLMKEDLPGFSASQAETSADRCFNCGCVAVSPSDMAMALMALKAKIKIAGSRGTEAAATAAVKGALPLLKNAYKIQITRTMVKRALLGEL